MSDFIQNEDRNWDQLVIRELVVCSQQLLHILLLKILLKNQFWINETLHLSMQMRSTLYSFAFLCSQKLKANLPEVTNYIAGCVFAFALPWISWLLFWIFLNVFVSGWHTCCTAVELNSDDSATFTFRTSLQTSWYLQATVTVCCACKQDLFEAVLHMDSLYTVQLNQLLSLTLWFIFFCFCIRHRMCSSKTLPLMQHSSWKLLTWSNQTWVGLPWVLSSQTFDFNSRDVMWQSWRSTAAKTEKKMLAQKIVRLLLIASQFFVN